MSFRNFELIDSSIGYAEGETSGCGLLEETLTDQSKTYSVKGYDSYQDEFIVDCCDRESAEALFQALIKAQHLG